MKRRKNKEEECHGSEVLKWVFLSLQLTLLDFGWMFIVVSIFLTIDLIPE